MEKLERLKKITKEKAAQYDYLKKSLQDIDQNIKNTTKEIECAKEAREDIQTIASEIQEQVHQSIASIVSRCLSTIFDEPYEFKILFERKRGRTEARLLFEREGENIDPLTSIGGGVIDVASFALRLACLILSRPKLQKIIIMDEPFKFLSEEYRENIVILLESLHEDLGVQFIYNTHIPELECGNVFRL